MPNTTPDLPINKKIKVKIFQGKKDSLWYSHIKGNNNEIIWSGEGVHNFKDCEDSAKLLNCPIIYPKKKP